jgi:hypothetical protein
VLAKITQAVEKKGGMVMVLTLNKNMQHDICALTNKELIYYDVVYDEETSSIIYVETEK